MDGRIIRIIERYAEFSTDKQLARLSEYYKKINHSGIDIEGSLLLLMRTKVGIFAKAKSAEINKNFKKIHKIINEIKEEDLENFINNISEIEKEEIRIFLSHVMGAITVCQHYQVMLLEGTVDRKEVIPNIKNLLSSKINNIEVIFREYISNPGKSTYSKFIEGKKESFYNRADEYRRRGVWALRVAVIFFLLLLFFGMFLTCSEYFYNSYDDRMNYFALVSFIGGKILVATTLFFALVASVRVYFAFSHNETICRHREDVLNSYEAIYVKLQDEDRKVAISKVTDAVFTQLPTGFTKLQSDEGKSGVSLDFISNLLRQSGSSSNP